MKSASIYILLALAVALVGPAAAQMGDQSPTQGISDHQSVQGTVVSTTSDAVTIKTDAGSQMTFSLASSSALPATVKAGDRVRIMYRMQGDEYLADGVSIDSGTTGSSSYPATAPASAASSTPPSGGMTDAAKPDNSAATAPSASTGAQEKMPATASPLPMVLAGGLIALALSLAAKQFKA